MFLIFRCYFSGSRLLSLKIEGPPNQADQSAVPHITGYSPCVPRAYPAFGTALQCRSFLFPLQDLNFSHLALLPCQSTHWSSALYTRGVDSRCSQLDDARLLHTVPCPMKPVLVLSFPLLPSAQCQGNRTCSVRLPKKYSAPENR